MPDRAAPYGGPDTVILYPSEAAALEARRAFVLQRLGEDDADGLIDWVGCSDADLLAEYEAGAEGSSVEVYGLGVGR